MSLRRLVRKLAALLAPLALVAAGAVTAQAQSYPAGDWPTGDCATGDCATDNCANGNCAAQVMTGSCAACQKKDCPPKFIVCTPKPPKIKFKCACPKPICEPCDLDPTGNYGYVPVCWRQWTAPPNYSHCSVPLPAQLLVNPVLVPPPVTPENELPPPSNALPPPSNELPPPKKLESQKNPPRTNMESVAVATPPKINTASVPDATQPIINEILLPVPSPLPEPTSTDDVLRTPKP